MKYFDGIKVNDRVWDLVNLWGVVSKIRTNYTKPRIVVNFDNNAINEFDFNGKPLYGLESINQTLFWDEIKFEIPKRPKIYLLEIIFFINISSNQVDKEASINYKNAGLARRDEETAKKALEQIRQFTRLLALRDQECKDSRGYVFKECNKNYYIHFVNADNKYKISEHTYTNALQVYFKTEEDAQKICDILNSGRFNLKGE